MLLSELYSPALQHTNNGKPLYINYSQIHVLNNLLVAKYPHTVLANTIGSLIFSTCLRPSHVATSWINMTFLQIVEYKRIILLVLVGVKVSVLANILPETHDAALLCCLVLI